MARDYYDVLGVSKNASKEEIKKAYKKMAKKYHPDISKEAGAETKFKEVNEAANVLLDDQKKQSYDAYGSAEGPQGFGGGAGGFSGGFNMDDLFSQFGFGGFSGGDSGFGFGGSRGRSRQKDTRVYSEIDISLDDVYFGVTKDVKISREDKCDICNGKGSKNASDVETCSNCQGSGVVLETKQTILGMVRTQSTCSVCSGAGEIIKNPCNSCHGAGSKKKTESVQVKVPKGVEDGVTLRISGKGDFDKETQTFGDLYLKIRVTQNKNYEVDGADLYKTVDVNFVQAILGDEIDFEHFDKTLSLKVPEGTQPGTILRLKGKGLPHFNYSSYGNLYIKINVDIPTKVTNKQKEILHDYAKTLKDKGFLSRLKKNIFG